MSARRWFGLIVLLGCVCASKAAEGGSTPDRGAMPALGPEAVRFPSKPGDDRQTPVERRRLDHRRLAGELETLLQIKQRVRRRLLEGRIGVMSREDIEEQLQREDDTPVIDSLGDEIEGPPEESRHLDLSVTNWKSGAQQVDAAIARERIQVIYTDLITLLGRSFDDQLVGNVRRRVSFHVADMPWQQALTSLLGQAGLAWRFNGDKIVLYQLDNESRQRIDVKELSERSFTRALETGDGLYAAQATYLLGQREQSENRLYDAMGRYLQVIEQYGETEDPAIDHWVRQARQGVGDVLMAMGEHREARTVFLNYISRAPDDDPELPRIRLAAAQASLRLAAGDDETEPDPAAAGRAKDLLQALIQDYRKDSDLADIVAEARVNLGEMFFERGEYAVAKEYFQSYADMLGLKVPDRLAWYLAECDYHLGIAAVRDRRFAAGDELLLQARARYERLTDHLRKNRDDPLVDPEVYRQAFFKMGLCHMRRSDPDFVKALFDFLRARQFFDDQPLEGRILVHIARCYHELQQDRQLVDTLFDLLRGDVLTNDAPGQVKMNDLLGDFETNLEHYGGPVQSKVRFYIAQARQREARWNPAERNELLRKAIHTYQLILKEPSLAGDLRLAAKIGIARAALDAGDGEQAVSHLREVIRSKATHPRDAALAMQLLLDHYRSQGRYADAIRGYQAYEAAVAE